MKILSQAITAIVVAVAAYHFYVALTGVPEPMFVRPIHVSALLFLGFLFYPLRFTSGVEEGHLGRPHWLDWLLATLGLVSAIYMIQGYERIAFRFPYLDRLEAADWVVGLLTIGLVFELTRRVVGIALPLIISTFIALTLLGPELPGFLRHPGVSVEKLLDHVFLTSKGIYGSLAALSLSVVFMFIAFGSALQCAGGERMLSQLIVAVTRTRRGGPAKAAVIVSVIFGALTGSGAANVYATGSVTIPLMRRAKYKKEFAAAVEACASQLGQLLPPVMGAAAFIVAEFSRVSYAYVATAALVPSFFYVMALYLAVHLESEKAGIGIYREEGPDITTSEILRRYGHLVIPLVVLIVLLVMRFTPYFAATVATLSVFPVSWLRRETRMKLHEVLQAIRTTVYRVVSIGIVLVCAGVGVATLEMTGVPYKITSMLVTLSGGNMFFALIIVGLMTIVLGFGMPVAGAFLIASLFGASALMAFGIDPFTAYMIIFLFALTANITPPVCIATFAAASIAQCSFMKAGIRGLQLGFPAYIIPIVIAYNPSLLDISRDGWLIGLQTLAATTVAIVGMVVLMSNWVYRPLNVLQRLLLVGSLFAIVSPSGITDLLAAAAVGVVLLWQWLDQKNRVSVAPPPLKERSN